MLFRSSEVAGQTDFNFYPENEARESFEEEQRILKTGRPLINKLERAKGRDGSESWQSITKVPIYNQQNTVTGLIGLAHDITKLKQTEQALRETEEKYRKIFENSVEGIFQTSPDGKYLSANPALARLYGYVSPQEMMSELTNIQEQLYVDPDRRGQFRQLISLNNSVTGFESEIRRDRKSTRRTPVTQ